MPHTLPELPDIASRGLRDEVFTHKSWQVTPAGLDADHIKPMNYERLATQGLAWLHAMAMWHYSEKRPYLRPVKLDVRKKSCIFIKSMLSKKIFTGSLSDDH